MPGEEEAGGAEEVEGSRGGAEIGEGGVGNEGQQMARVVGDDVRQVRRMARAVEKDRQAAVGASVEREGEGEEEETRGEWVRKRKEEKELRERLTRERLGWRSTAEAAAVVAPADPGAVVPETGAPLARMRLVELTDMSRPSGERHVQVLVAADEPARGVSAVDEQGEKVQAGFNEEGDGSQKAEWSDDKEEEGGGTRANRRAQYRGPRHAGLTVVADFARIEHYMEHGGGV